MPDLHALTAGLLLIHDARNPGAPIDLVAELAAEGVSVGAEQLREILEQLELEHCIVTAPADGGHRLVEMERRYKTARSSCGVEMVRDPESGRYTGRSAVAGLSASHGK